MLNFIKDIHNTSKKLKKKKKTDVFSIVFHFNKSQ